METKAPQSRAGRNIAILVFAVFGGLLLFGLYDGTYGAQAREEKAKEKHDAEEEKARAIAARRERALQVLRQLEEWRRDSVEEMKRSTPLHEESRVADWGQRDFPVRKAFSEQIVAESLPNASWHEILRCAARMRGALDAMQDQPERSSEDLGSVALHFILHDLKSCEDGAR